MKSFYIGRNAIIILGLAIIALISAKKRGKVAKPIIQLCVCFTISIISCFAQLFANNRYISSALFASYYLVDLFIIFVFHNYVCILTRTVVKERRIVFRNYLYFSLAIIDFIALAVNVFGEFVFKVSSAQHNNVSFWNCEFQKNFYFHLSIISIFLLQLVVGIVIRCIKLPRFFRIKLFTSGFLFLMIFVSKEMFRNSGLPYDSPSYLDLIFVFYIFQTAFYGIYKNIANEMLSLVSENISYAVVFFNEKHKCFYMNNKAHEIFGTEKAGVLCAEGYRDKLRNLYGNSMYNFLKLTQTFNIEQKEHIYECEYKIIRDKKQRTIVSYIKLEDITDEQERLEQEKYRTEHDSLTDLYNRAAFFKYAAEILKANPEETFFLIATNIMDFKVVNNLFGEQFGDELLKCFAKRLSTISYPNKICGRISGDKFAVLIQKRDFKNDEIVNTNSVLQQALQKYNFKVKNYIGVYEISDHNEAVQSMFDKAALTIQNMRGDLEQTIAFYDMPFMEKLLREKRVISEFDTALANGEFTMYLHPQIKAENSHVMGAEALVRWITPNKEIIPPIEFIPLLEQSGMIHKLDQYIWELAVKKLADWKKIGNDMYISINISPKDFYYCDVYKFLKGLVEKYNVDPQKLNIEITETVFMQNVDTHRAILQSLRDYGFTIEMDDFGSGYSSLNTLKNLEMNILKIDMEFLRDWDKNKKNRDIISSIIAMSKALGMVVVSEGVETEDQAEFLKDVGCDIFQGFFFSKPIPPEEFEKRYVDGGR